METLFQDEPLPDPVVATVRLDRLPAVICAPLPTAEMVASVKRFGVLDPIILTETIVERKGRREESKLDIENGRGRVLAARAAGLTEIPAHIYPRGLYAPGVLTMMLNRQRRANPAAELAIVERLLSEGHAQSDICQATGKTKAEVNALLELVNLSPELRQAFAEGRLSVSCAGRAARLTPAQMLRLVTTLAENGKITTKDVAHARLTERQAAGGTIPWDDLLAGKDAEDTDIPWRSRIASQVRMLAQTLPTEAPAHIHSLVEGLRAWVEGECDGNCSPKAA